MSRLGFDPPKCLGLIPCQSATRNESSKQWTIVGTFNQMEIGDKFPVMVPEVNVYVSLGRGSEEKDTVHLAILSATGDVLGLCISPVLWETNSCVEFYAPLRNVVFRTPGKYTLRLFVEGHVLAEMEIKVLQAKWSAVGQGRTRDTGRARRGIVDSDLGTPALYRLRPQRQRAA